MFLHIKWPDWAACGLSLGALAGSWWGYVPGVVALVASLVSIAWVVRQWTWAKRDRKGRK